MAAFQGGKEKIMSVHRCCFNALFFQVPGLQSVKGVCLSHTHTHTSSPPACSTAMAKGKKKIPAPVKCQGSASAAATGRHSCWDGSRFSFRDTRLPEAGSVTQQSDCGMIQRSVQLLPAHCYGEGFSLAVAPSCFG